MPKKTRYPAEYSRQKLEKMLGDAHHEARQLDNKVFELTKRLAELENRPPRLTDGELIALAVVGTWMTGTNEPTEPAKDARTRLLVELRERGLRPLLDSGKSPDPVTPARAAQDAYRFPERNVR